MTTPSFEGLTPRSLSRIGLLDRGQRGAVVRLDDQLARLGHLEPGELLQRNSRSVVLDQELLDERGRGPARADRRELVLHVLDCLLHLLDGVEEGLFGHANSVVRQRTTCGHPPWPDWSPGGSSWRRLRCGFSPRWMIVPTCSTSQDRLQRAGRRHVEHHDGHVVVAAERDRRGVHDLQVLGHHVHVVDRVVLDRRRVDARVGAVDAVDARVGALDQHVGLDLGGAQRRGGVGGEERVAGTGGEDDDAALLEVAHRPAADVRLGDAGHLDRAEHPGVLPGALERVLQRERVHDRAEHADVVALGGVHAGHRARAAAPEVAATDDDGDVDAELADGDDLACGVIERGAVEAGAGGAGQVPHPMA